MSPIPSPGIKRTTGSGHLATPQTRLAQRLRHLRETTGLSRGQLADQLGSAETRIVDWEIGVNTPTLPTLARYARVFGMTVSELLDGVM